MTDEDGGAAGPKAASDLRLRARSCGNWGQQEFFSSPLTRPAEPGEGDDEPTQKRKSRVGKWRGQIQRRKAENTADAKSPRKLLSPTPLLSHQTAFMRYKALPVGCRSNFYVKLFFKIIRRKNGFYVCFIMWDQTFLMKMQKIKLFHSDAKANPAVWPRNLL